MGIFQTMKENQIVRQNKSVERKTVIELNNKLLDLYSEFKKHYDEYKKLQESLVDKQLFFRTNQENTNKLLDLQKSIYSEVNSKFSEIVDRLFQKNQDFITTKSNEFLAIHREYSAKLLDFESRVDKIDLIYTAHKSLSSELTGLKTDIEKMKELEESYKDIALHLVESKINSQAYIRETAEKGASLILEAFNEELAVLNEKDQSSIAEAMRKILEKKKILSNTPLVRTKKVLPADSVFHSRYDKLKNVLLAGVIPMVVGPAGSGKSHAIEQIALELGLDFYMANRIQNTFELVGFVNASGEYVTTQFYEAFTKGGLFFFDEVDASSPEALVTINAAVAQGYMAFPGHENNVVMHKDFKVVVAGNTYGTGSTLQYTGRNKLDAATLDRFMVIDWPYDEKLENILIKDKDLLAICWALRKAATQFEDIIISSRGILSLEKIIAQETIHSTTPVSELFKQKFFPTAKHEKILKVVNALSTNSNLKNNKYYSHVELLPTL